MASEEDEVQSIEVHWIHAGLTVRELYLGRKQWLSDHIVRFDGEIHPAVASAILALLEGTDPELQYELRLVRKAGLGRKAKPLFHSAPDDFELALEVAKLGGFERGKLEGACIEVALKRRMNADTVRKKALPYKDLAIFEMSSQKLSSDKPGD